MGKWLALVPLCALLAACALRPGSGEARETSAMGNAAANMQPAASGEGASIAAGLGYHGPVRGGKPAD